MESIKKKNMNIDKLERANILAKSLIPKVDELLNMSSKAIYGRLADAIMDFQSVMKSLKPNSSSF